MAGPTFLSAYTNTETASYPAFVNLSANGEYGAFTELVVTTRRQGLNGLGFSPVDVIVPKSDAVPLLKDALLNLLTREEIEALAQEMLGAAE